MGWLDEYNKALKKYKKEEEQNSSQSTTPKTTSQNSGSSGGSWMQEYERSLAKYETQKEQAVKKVADSVTVGKLTSSGGKDDGKKWYEKGHFEDGWDFGDVTKTILGISPKKELKTFETPDTTDSLETLKQKQAYYAGRKWSNAEQTAEALKVTQQYNQMALAQYSETLSKTKMDGQNHTVLEEIEILANMKSGKEKDKRKDAVLKKMEELGMDTAFYSHFAGDGEFDWRTFGQWLKNASFAGLNSFNKGLLDTADVLLGNPLKAMGWENNPISKGADYYGDLYSSYRYNANVLAEKLGGDAWNFATDATEGTMGAVPNALLAIMTAGQSVTASAGSLATNAVAQAGNFLTKAGLTVETMMRNPQFWMSFGRTLGSDYNEAKENGASDIAASVGSVLKSLVNAGIEIGPGGDSGFQGLPKGIKEGGKPFWEWVESSLEEGGEEMLQKFVGEVVDKVGYGSDAEILNPIEYAKEGSIGVISGMALGGGQIGIQSAANAVNEHQANKLTDMEKSVRDKIVESRISKKEKGGKTLTAKEKADITKEVDRLLRKGYLQADEIESVLGGEAYGVFKAEQDKFFASEGFQNYQKAKKDADKRIAKLEKQLKELEDAPNTVGNSKKYDAVQLRLDALKKRTESMREQLLPEANRIMGIRDEMRSQVMGTVKDSKLAEVYRELERKKQKFEVDVSKYTNENAKKTVQSILDSGLGDNSNQFHETVEWLASLSEQKGVTFDLTENKRLKGTEHYKEGYITHGFVNENGDIMLNMDSDRVLETTVGHEITHVLEKAGIYEDLSRAVRDFSITKEGLEKYNARIAEAEAIYKGNKNTTAEKEVTADLIGEYLFTDYNFVSNLAKTNQTTFQHIWTELKHMAKIATAGSKEARELEKAKMMFERAWRENGSAKQQTQSQNEAETSANEVTVDPENDSDLDYESPTKYSVTVKDPETIDFLENQEHITTYKAMILVDGKLYPPMASKVKGEDGKYHMTNPRELGEWMQAEEDTTNIKFNDKGIGYYDLKKDDGGTVRAAYNPYEHSSNLVLNDQFEAAYKRENLVTVECVVPKSEMTSGYKAEYAKDSTGMMDWHSGVVAGKLTDNKRSVYLSRYLKAVRIVPDSEVAQKYKEIVGDLAVPFNVVSPSLLTELENVGVNIDYDGSPQYQYLQRRAAEKAKADTLEQKVLDTKSIQYSYSAIPSHKKSLEKNFDFQNASMDLETINQRYDKIIDIWERLGGELDSKFLNDWNNKVERPFTIFKAQSGYKYNVELSSMCKKGVPLFEAIDTIVKKEVMKELDMKVMGKEEKEILYDILKQKHFEIPCAICYVEQARQREGIVIDAFLNGKAATDKKGADVKLGWNQVLDSIQKEMKANGVDYTFNFVSREIATDKYIPAESDMDEQTYTAFAEAVKKIANEEITRYNKANGKNRPLLKEVTPEAVKECFKGGLPSNLKIFKVLLTEPSSRFKIQNDLLYSSMTTKNLTMAHNGLYSLFNSQGGVSGYKTKQAPTVYWGEILGKKWKPEDTRKEGGIRNQSNSDFQMYTLLDQAQMYMDFSAKGYYLQAYTKVLSELKLFGLSRGKINASLIPQVKVYRNADGTVDVEKTMENAGLDENGNPIYDDIEGINHREAFMLLEDPDYSKNIGGICIGYSDNHIRKLLDDSRVQLIIGFHDKTNDPNKRYRGARYAKNYNGLNEATKTKADGTSETVHIGFNPFVKKAEQKFQFNKDTETFEGTVTYKGKTYTADDIPRLATDLYLEHCAKKGLTPAYDEFHTHPNYYKLLADFSLYDSEGHYAPHQKVAYNMPDSVPYLDADGNKQYMSSEDYIKIELQKELAVRDSLIDALADDSEDGIIPRFKAEVEKRSIAPKTQYSLSERSGLDIQIEQAETGMRILEENRDITKGWAKEKYTELSQELEDLLVRKHGVSGRHKQLLDALNAKGDELQDAMFAPNPDQAEIERIEREYSDADSALDAFAKKYLTRDDFLIDAENPWEDYVDNEGHRLTYAQEKFFENSKIRDKDGKLRRVYHTTQNDFTVFDHARKGEATDGPNTFLGFFFAESPNHMEQFPEFQGGKTDSYYLDMKKPMDLTNLSKEAFMDIVELTGGDRFEAAEAYDEELKAEQSRARLRGDNNTTLSISQLLYNMVGDYYHADFFDALKPNYDKLIAKGYDGVIDYLDEMMGEREFVVFDSNQAKLTSNANPTSDPDTRFSVSKKSDELGDGYIPSRDIGVHDEFEDFIPIREDTTNTEKFSAVEVSPEVDIPETETTAEEVVEDEPAEAEPVEDIDEDDIPIKTVNERLTAKRANSQTELDNNRRLRAEAAKSFDEKIAKAQAQLDSKKNKDTKVANNIRRRIERLQRLKADVDAQYAKRISDIENRLSKTDEELQKDHTKQDQYERTIARINKVLEMDKADLDTEFAQKREAIADKNSYISQKASELYKEIRGLKKGVRASEQLAYLLDHGYDWSSIRSALVNIKHTPGETVNINSEAESVAREMLNEDYEQAQYDLDDEYHTRLSALESEADTKRKSARVANQRMVKNQEYAEQMENLIGDTSTWVDKKMGISYKVNTLRRNLRDIVRDAQGKRDIAKADAIYDELQGKYNHNEAMLNREANRIKSPYADLKITDAEDAYIQMLGELRHNPDTELTADAVNEFYEKHKNKIDTAKVDQVIASARETYDTLLQRVNEVLREQGMKEIPYRQGYFPHFTDPKQGWLAKLLNWKVKDFTIPTDIAGLTEQFNPNRSWQAFNKQRKSDTTDYSFKKGLDTYVQGALDWIYHIEDIQKRRAFENHIRYVHSEKGIQARIDAIRQNTEYDADEMQEQIDLVYKEAGNPLNNFVTDLRAGTNTLANKKSSLDRGMEELVNRKVYSTMTNLSNRVSGNMVAGSISSALTNFIPITQSWMEVSPVSSLRAMGDTIKSTFRDDGTIEKSDFLTNRLRQSESLYKTGWDKVSDKVGFLMEAVDSFTSQTVWRSKYLENISKGMSESEAIKNADQFSENVMAGRSRGNMPTIFDSKNPLIKTLTAFQLEVNNQYEYFFKDAPQDLKNESTGKLIKGYATAFLGAYAYNALYSSLVGRDAAFDPIGIIEEFLKDLFGDDDDEEPVDAILGLTDNIMEEVPFVGGLLGGGRIPISSALPYDGVYEAFKGTVEDVANEDWENLTNEWLNPLWYLAMPLGGGQIRKTVQGLSMFDDDLPISGSYTSSGKLRFPVEDTFGNRVKAGLFGQYASKNARDYFDNGRSPLGEEQIQEFMDVDIPIRDYWEYREGLRGLSKIGEKADYIDSLDLPISKKNLLINNIADREDPIDLTGYGNYNSFDEFEFAKENPEKYEIAKAVGGYDRYMTFREGMKDMKFSEKVDYVAGLNLTTRQKNILINGETDRKEPIDLTGYEGFNSYEEFEYAKENPKDYTISKAVADDFSTFLQYMEDCNNFDAKDANGKTVSGLKKERVKNYVFGLDIDYGQQIILFRSMYDSKADKATYNADIVEYLNSRNDISYEDTIAILESLDMKVDSNGNVSW